MLPQAALYARLLPNPHDRDTMQRARTENEQGQRSDSGGLFSAGRFLLAHQSKDGVAAVPAFAEADIDSLSGPERPARKIEWVYRARPETIGESWGI